jgi:hypothetical protein
VEAVLDDLAPTIPRSAYTMWAPSARDRLAWHRRITALNATAAHHSIDRDTAQHVLLALMDTAEWHTRIWTLDDLFHTAVATVRLLASTPRGPASVTSATPAAHRPMHTAWTRFTQTRNA